MRTRGRRGSSPASVPAVCVYGGKRVRVRVWFSVRCRCRDRLGMHASTCKNEKNSPNWHQTTIPTPKIDTSMHTHRYKHAYPPRHRCTHLHTHARAQHIHTRTQACTHPDIRAHTHTQPHTFAHTRAHRTYTHTHIAHIPESCMRRMARSSLYGDTMDATPNRVQVKRWNPCSTALH